LGATGLDRDSEPVEAHAGEPSPREKTAKTTAEKAYAYA